MEQREIDNFRHTLLAVRLKLLGDSSSIEDGALSQTRSNSAGDLSSVPIHFADIGSDTFEQELSLDILSNKHELLSEINSALDRINDNTFGKCEECGGEINIERLNAIPYARLCIECQKQIEKENNS
jgi:RNA polymerase-binding protein DksA